MKQNEKPTAEQEPQQGKEPAKKAKQHAPKPARPGAEKIERYTATVIE